MTIGFLCSMLQSDVTVFVEKDSANTLYTSAGRLVDSREVVGDFHFIPSGAIIIKSIGVIE